MEEHYVSSAPVSEPITLDEMRLHLGITQTTDTSRDSVIQTRIKAARSWAEKFTRRPFITQTFTGYYDNWPECGDYTYRFDLRSPVQSVTSIKYIDEDGTQQTLSASLYDVDKSSPDRVFVIPKYGQDWPTVREYNNAVEIIYVAGYGAAAAVPEDIKEALRFIVGQWEVFQPSIEGVMRPFTIPYAAEQLLAPYRDFRAHF